MFTKLEMLGAITISLIGGMAIGYSKAREICLQAKLATEVVLRFRDIDGEHEIKTCYGDIYKIVNVFMDYARLLELIGDEWGLDAYHRAVNEVTADKLRSIAKKYQEAIGYDYEDALAKKKKAHKDDDVGGDALELAFKKNQRNAAKKKKEK